jgi:hypothetical protein
MAEIASSSQSHRSLRRFLTQNSTKRARPLAASKLLVCRRGFLGSRAQIRGLLEMNMKNVRQEWGANVNAAITASEAAASWEPSVARERPAPPDREGCRTGEGVCRRWRVPSRTQSWSEFYTQHPRKAYDWSGFEIIHFLQKIGIWSGLEMRPPHLLSGVLQRFGRMGAAVRDW